MAQLKTNISDGLGESQEVIPKTDPKNKINKSTKLTKQNKSKQVYARVNVDPTKKYKTPESRESWGPNVKGKKFRKEKGKKKRCPNAGVRIDGSVKSVRLDA